MFVKKIENRKVKQDLNMLFIGKKIPLQTKMGSRRGKYVICNDTVSSLAEIDQQVIIFGVSD